MDQLTHLTAAAMLVASATAFVALGVRAVNEALDRLATHRRIARRLRTFAR